MTPFKPLLNIIFSAILSISLSNNICLASDKESIITHKEASAQWHLVNRGRYGNSSIETISIYGNHQTVEFAALSIDCSDSFQLIPNLRYSFFDSSEKELLGLEWWEQVGGEALLSIGDQTYDFSRVTEPRPMAHPFMLNSKINNSEVELINTLNENHTSITATFTILSNKHKRDIELSNTGFDDSLDLIKRTCVKP